MKTKLTYLFILVYSCIFSQKGKIAGFIYDKEKNIIPNATIYFDSIEKIIYSNKEDFITLLRLNLENILFITICLDMRKK